MKQPGTKQNPNLKWFIIGGLFITLIIFGFVYLSPYSAYYIWRSKGGSGTTTPPDLSHFSAYDYLTGENVSDTAKGSIWTPLNVSEVPDWEEEDYLNITLYNETIASELFEDMSIDLSDIPVFFIEVASYGGYANNFYLCGTDGNNDFTCYAFPNSDDVDFNIVDDVFNEINVSGHHTDGTYWIIYSVPDPNTEIQAPLYSPEDDTLLDWDNDDPLSYYTDMFGFQFIFNDTIGDEDGDPVQVNFTICETVPTVVLWDDDNIYVLFPEVQTFSNATMNAIYYAIAYGTDISLSDVDAVRVLVPSNSEGTITPTKIGDIAE